MSNIITILDQCLEFQFKLAAELRSALLEQATNAEGLGVVVTSDQFDRFMETAAKLAGTGTGPRFSSALDHLFEVSR